MQVIRRCLTNLNLREVRRGVGRVQLRIANPGRIFLTRDVAAGNGQPVNVVRGDRGTQLAIVERNARKRTFH